MGPLVEQEHWTNVRGTFMLFSCSTSNCCCFCFYWDFVWASWVFCPKALGPEHDPPSEWWRTPVMCCSKQRKTALRQTISAQSDNKSTADLSEMSWVWKKMIKNDINPVTSLKTRQKPPGTTAPVVAGGCWLSSNHRWWVICKHLLTAQGVEVRLWKVQCKIQSKRFYCEMCWLKTRVCGVIARQGMR